MFTQLSFGIFIELYKYFWFSIFQLANLLPNHIGTEIVPRKGWSHFDFAYSSSAGELVFKSIIETMNNNETFDTTSNLQCQQKNETMPINVIS